MTVKILQFGTTGQLATELLRQASSHDVTLTALSRAGWGQGEARVNL